MNNVCYVVIGCFPLTLLNDRMQKNKIKYWRSVYCIVIMHDVICLGHITR